jgi:hypothetical protein
MTRVLLWAASWIVPHDLRRGWHDEWRAELWHVRQVERGLALRFSFGAFRDALWLRRHDPSPRRPLLASPLHCLVLLAILAGAAFAVHPVERVPQDMVKIRPHGALTVTYDQYRAFVEHRPHGFDAVAFYRLLPGGAAVATPSAGEVLRGSSLPGALRFRTAEYPGAGPGYMIARVHVRPGAPPWHIPIPSEDGRVLLFDCVPTASGIPFIPFLMILFAAMVVASATTSFSVGQMTRHAWLFLAVKIILAITAAGFGAACLPLPIMPQAMIVSLAMAVRWSLNDQRRRCPVCLRRVTNPVSFGCLSHTLLDWHGSEFVCPEGHGLLQISATFASPYAAQQWVRL